MDIVKDEGVKLKLDAEEMVIMGEHFESIQSKGAWKSVVKLFDVLKKRWMYANLKIGHPNMEGIAMERIKYVSRIAAIEDILSGISECINEFNKAEEARKGLDKKEPPRGFMAE